MEKREMVCIVCPMGCRLNVQINDDETVVSGNKCPRGEIYAIKELTNPTRVITTTVKVEGGLLNRLPVKTKDAVPKGLIDECMNEINKVKVIAPVKVGDIIISNILNTGVDVVASRSM